METLSILEFNNYRDFLSTVGRRRSSKRSRPLTLSQWAKRLGYRSPQSVGMVLSGRRLPGQEMILRLSRQLGFSDAEQVYFSLLVQIERGKSRGKNVAHLVEELYRSRKGRSSERVLSAEAFAYVADWYHLVIRQMIKASDFIESAESMHKRLRKKVTPAEIKSAISNMLHLGVLKRERDGKLKASDENLTTIADVPTEAGRVHLRQMLDRAREALEEQPVDRREFDAKTFRMDPKRIAEAKKELRALRTRFLEKFASADSSHVFQFNFQLFEHTDFEITEGEDRK